MKHSPQGMPPGGSDDRPNLQPFEVVSDAYRPSRPIDGRGGDFTKQVTYETPCGRPLAERVSSEHPAGGTPPHREERSWAMRGDLPRPSDSEAACEIPRSEGFPVPRSVTMHSPPSSRWSSVVAVGVDTPSDPFPSIRDLARPSHDDRGRAA